MSHYFWKNEWKLQNTLEGAFRKALIGVVGGAVDITCLKRITDYAALKYKRRFLLRNCE